MKTLWKWWKEFTPVAAFFSAVILPLVIIAGLRARESQRTADVPQGAQVHSGVIHLDPGQELQLRIQADCRSNNYAYCLFPVDEKLEPPKVFIPEQSVPLEDHNVVTFVR